MTFYNIIFGFLFIGAFRETIRSFDMAIQPDGEWIAVWQSLTLAVLVSSDAIYTSEMVEGRGREYTFGRKLIDLGSFIVLGFVILLIDPSEDSMLQLNVVHLNDWIVERLHVTHESIVWGLMTVYFGLLILWNEIHPSTYEPLPPKDRRLRYAQPILALAVFVPLTILTSFFKKDCIVLALLRPMSFVGSVAYLVFFKTLLVKRLTEGAKLKVLQKRLTLSDAQTVLHWPPYPPVFTQLDYALRHGGWLEQFPESPTCHRLAWWQNGELVGFSILTHIENASAEFYIAVHPDKLKHKIGEQITRETLTFGFEKLHLHRIYLKVRTWHTGAKRLYERVGFKETGKQSDQIQGALVEFYSMEIFAP